MVLRRLVISLYNKCIESLFGNYKASFFHFCFIDVKKNLSLCHSFSAASINITVAIDSKGLKMHNLILVTLMAHKKG